MKVVVTSAIGFVEVHVACVLLARGDEVLGFGSANRNRASTYAPYQSRNIGNNAAGKPTDGLTDWRAGAIGAANSNGKNG